MAPERASRALRTLLEDVDPALQVPRMGPAAPDVQFYNADILSTSWNRKSLCRGGNITLGELIKMEETIRAFFLEDPAQKLWDQRFDTPAKAPLLDPLFKRLRGTYSCVKNANLPYSWEVRALRGCIERMQEEIKTDTIKKAAAKAEGKTYERKRRLGSAGGPEKKSKQQQPGSLRKSNVHVKPEED